jgi:hypothetical protein
MSNLTPHCPASSPFVMLWVVATLLGVSGCSYGDDAGKTVHPAGAIFSFTIPKHFITGSYGGSRNSKYTGPQEGPGFTHIQLNDSSWEEIAVEVVHGQSELGGRTLLRGIAAGARAEAKQTGGRASGFHLITVAGHPAVQWRAGTYSQEGFPLVLRKTYIAHGTDAAIVKCRWRDKPRAQQVESGCDAVLASFRFTS